MIKKIMLASCLLVASMGSHASMISYNGYERDTATNYVTGGGLEWLMWDATKGLSIDQATAAHGADGWVLASNTHMATLFNAFQFGRPTWPTDENSSGGAFVPAGASGEAPFMFFMQLFGITRSVFDSFGFPYFEQTIAMYGNDDDMDGRINLVTLSKNYDFPARDYEYSAHMSYDFIYAHNWDNYAGVALVRDVSVVPPAQVSLPGSLSLLALGLVAFGIRRRQASRR